MWYEMGLVYFAANTDHVFVRKTALILGDFDFTQRAGKIRHLLMGPSNPQQFLFARLSLEVNAPAVYERNAD